MPVTSPAEQGFTRGDDDADLPEDPAAALGGRAQLIDDLAVLLRPESAPALLAIVFFEGFTGRTRRQGDRTRRRTLIARCATLARALGPAASCYRLREAEFAALIRGPAEDSATLLAWALAQVEDDQAGGSDGLAFGSCVLPREAGEPVQALGLAGERLTQSRRGREARESAPVPARTAQAG
jgi:hypothetical protein